MMQSDFEIHARAPRHARGYPGRPLDRLYGGVGDGLSPAAVTRELWVSAVLMAVTAFAIVMFGWDSLDGLRHRLSAHHVGASVEQVVLVVVLGFLVFGNVVYQVARIGYLRRRAAHRPEAEEDLAAFAAGGLPRLVTLVPSYREERAVVAQTLLSAALQRYPNRVVLLLDDPPSPQGDEEREALDAMRLLPAEIEARLAVPAARIRARRAEFDARLAKGALDRRAETRAVADLWAMASGWFAVQAEAFAVGDHTDAFFVEHILRQPQSRAAARAAELRGDGVPADGLDRFALLRELTALEHLFSCELTTFERKRYVNLSDAPNKAMNLNTYIGLLGGAFRDVARDDGVHLVGAGDDRPDLAVPAADYVITLDADSLLAPDYALRLVFEMERPGNERIAVMQTPYCAIPGATSALERTAGATTDIQHILHQGSTSFRATSWVGANAVLRRAALEDIRAVEDERGFRVTRFIQDRTVIEDTESSIDLIAAGWRLHNYPDTLAVSATPPDFGALAIQRARWANGGLIILPKLFRYLVRGPGRAKKVMEGAVRFHYLSSIAAVNVGLLIVFSYPFHRGVVSAWLPLTAAPYFFLYARDLRHVGYRAREVVTVYALNLALVPVNLAGVFKSVQQAVTRRKMPFARTPKVAGRTRVPARYLVAQLVALLYWTMGALSDAGAGRWGRTVFELTNVALLGFAVVYFIGLRAAASDLVAPLRRIRTATVAPDTATTVDATVDQPVDSTAGGLGGAW